MKRIFLSKAAVVAVFMLSSVAHMVSAQLAKQDLNAPFGWANCSSATTGDDYTVTGGGQSADSIILKSTGGDMRNKISSALKKHDIIILDGSAGDFTVSYTIDMNGLQDKTIVGINGARLCSRFSVTDEIRAVLDKAGVMNAKTSSGTGGILTNGAKVREEREFCTRQTLIDFTGDSLETYRRAGIFGIKDCNNIIVRNLKFVGPGSCDVGGSDLISATNTTHLWVDHCDFTDGMDGNFDITNECDFVTVSWCTFSYTDRSYDHRNTNLIGGNDKHLADEGKLHVTFANCVWGKDCSQRMPMVRYGMVHLLNNYYNCPGNSAAVNPRINSTVFVEGNFFAAGVKKIFSTKDAKAFAFKGNHYTEKFTQPDDCGTVSVPYAYKAVCASRVPDMVMSEYGAGATLRNPLKIGN